MNNHERRQSDVDLALLRQDMDTMKVAMEKLETQVGGLLEAWRTATGLVRFIKWAAGLATALAVLWAFAKDHVK